MAGNEFDFIDWVTQHVTDPPGELQVGIGDDAAVWTTPEGSTLLLATDLLMEGTHFRFDSATPRQVGHKALAVNLSDIAAMAGIPQTALVSLALPRSPGEALAHELMSGLLATAQRYDVSLIGGDTNVWDGPLVVNVAVTGTATERGPVLRTGAIPGDVLFVTGPLGGSLGGRHFSFEPRVREALTLHRLVDLHAMIDLSDGLGSDLRHLLRAGRCGAVLQEAEIPISDAARSATGGRSPFERALFDGEDFELLLAVSGADAETLQRQPDVHLFRIGEITDRPGELVLESPAGARRIIEDAGWKHHF